MSTLCVDHQYQGLLSGVLNLGVPKGDRTGTGTLSVFGQQLHIDLAEGFPLLTTKRVHFKSVLEELKWFLRGETNVRSLQERGVTIWDEWADEDGNLGPVYGHQWRNWGSTTERDWSGHDQIDAVVETLKGDPDSRRIIVSAWNVADLPDMALAPCHLLFQFYSRELTLLERKALLETAREVTMAGSKDEAFVTAVLDAEGVPRRALSCQVYQRSADLFLGVPFNIASYALLTHVMAVATGHAVEKLVWTGGDIHLYRNHLVQAQQQLARMPRALPRIRFNRDRFTVDDFAQDAIEVEIVGYDPHPAIPAPVAV